MEKCLLFFITYSVLIQVGHGTEIQHTVHGPLRVTSENIENTENMNMPDFTKFLKSMGELYNTTMDALYGEADAVAKNETEKIIQTINATSLSNKSKIEGVEGKTYLLNTTMERMDIKIDRVAMETTFYKETLPKLINETEDRMSNKIEALKTSMDSQFLNNVKQLLEVETRLQNKLEDIDRRFQTLTSAVTSLSEAVSKLVPQNQTNTISKNKRGRSQQY